MQAVDPKQAVIDFLSQPQGERVTQPEPAHAPEEGKKWVGVTHRGGGMHANPTTIRFHKERSIAHRQLHAVSFEDNAGRAMHFVCCLAQDEHGLWRFESGGGGGGGFNAATRHRSARPHPWANLAGGGWETRFWAGGTIIDQGLDVTRVRLIGSNGQVLEDSVDNSLVLFLTDQRIRVPVQVELHGRSGELVGKHSWF